VRGIEVYRDLSVASLSSVKGAAKVRQSSIVIHSSDSGLVNSSRGNGKPMNMLEYEILEPMWPTVFKLLDTYRSECFPTWIDW